MCMFLAWKIRTGFWHVLVLNWSILLFSLSLPLYSSQTNNFFPPSSLSSLRFSLLSSPRRRRPLRGATRWGVWRSDSATRPRSNPTSHCDSPTDENERRNGRRRRRKRRKTKKMKKKVKKNEEEIFFYEKVPGNVSDQTFAQWKWWTWFSSWYKGMHLQLLCSGSRGKLWKV